MLVSPQRWVPTAFCGVDSSTDPIVAQNYYNLPELMEVVLKTRLVRLTKYSESSVVAYRAPRVIFMLILSSFAQ